MRKMRLTIELDEQHGHNAYYDVVVTGTGNSK